MKTIEIYIKGSRFYEDLECFIDELLTNEYGYDAVMNFEIDFCDALYSSGFIFAINEGGIPRIEKIQLSGAALRGGEYHHLYYNDTCYVVYFNEY
jgi:hypothetical protein